MKKLLLMIVSAAFIFTACNFQVPKSVSVKTKADYNFTLAKLDLDLEDYFNVTSLVSNVGTNGIKVYDYNPGNKSGRDVPQQFLIGVPIQTIPIDIEQYFDDVDLTDIVKDLSFSQKISIPAFPPMSVTEDVPVNFSSALGDVIAPFPPTGIYTNDYIDFLINLKLDTKQATSAFENCKIADGELKIELQFDSSWVNPDVKWDVEIDGAIKSATESQTGLAYRKNLQNVDFSKADALTAKIRIYVKADSANIKKLPKVTASCTVNKLDEIKVALPAGFKAEITENIDINSTLGFVESVKLGESKITGIYTNTLPAGNDFVLEVKSDFLGIDATGTKQIKINSGGGFVDIDAEKGKEIKKDLTGKFPDADFEAKFLLGGDKDYITIKNVEFGKEYEIGVDVKLAFDWEQVSFKPTDFNMAGSHNISTGVDISGIFDSLKTSIGSTGGDFLDNIKIPTLPLYLYCQIPTEINALQNLKFEGDITLGTVDASNNFTAYKKDDPANPGNKKDWKLFEGGIKNHDVPKFETIDNSYIDSNGDKVRKETVTTDIGVKAADDTDACSEKVELAELLNSKTSGTLAVQCNNLGFGSSAGSNSITIKKSDIDALSKQKKVEIAIMAYIVLPISFKVEKDGDPANKAYEFALPSFGSGTDLLGRSAKLDNETLFTYLDVIKDARFELDTSLLPIAVNPEDPNNKLKLSVDLRKPDGTSVIQKKDLVLSGKGQFSLTGDEIETLLTEYPIDPAQSKIAIEFPKGSLYMRRDMKFGTSVNLGISTDGTIKLDDLKGGN